MSMTVTEKDQWTKLIDKRITRKIEDLWASDPPLKERINRQAEELAYSSLGLAAFKTRREEIEVEIQALNDEDSAIEEQMAKTVDPTIDIRSCYRLRSAVESAITARTHSERARLMEESAIGRSINMLYKEKEQSQEAVLLATGPAAIKDFYRQISEKLEMPLSELEDLACK
jgi:uncharacterized coiled-coil DUF342 family protein